MGERRWDLMVLKDFSTLEGSQPNAAGWVPSGLPLHTDAEVLAEMGGKRRWRCAFRQVDWSWPAMECQRKWREHEVCGWVWIVKE